MLTTTARRSNVPSTGKLEQRCPWEGCSGKLEVWKEQIFENTFLAMGCMDCPAFWIWSDGEWLCSMPYTEWRQRVYGQGKRMGVLGRLGDGCGYPPD